MATTYATPGVYIEELTGPGVITGVGTNTAGFIGPALNGSINKAKSITSWDAFQKAYGRPGTGGRREVYIVSPRRFFLAHAVRAFFDNGGRNAYVVRVGTARHAYRNLSAVGTGNALRVEARTEGLAGNNISVQVQHTNLASGLQVTKPTATITTASGKRVVVNNAANFRPGDVVTRHSTSERQTIQRIDYTSNEVFLVGNLTGTYNSGTLRIANLQSGQKMFRLASTTGLYAGSVVTIQRGGTSETATIANVRNGFITLESGLLNNYNMATAATPVTVTSHEFSLTITAPGVAAETFANLSMNRRHPRFYDKIITAKQVTVRAADPATTAAAPNDRPAAATLSLTNGVDDDLTAIGASDYEDGIKAFNVIDDVNFLCIPDARDSTVQTKLIDHCVKKGDRFAILDAPRGLDPTAVLAHRALVESERGFAALYYPWLIARDPTTRSNKRINLPPSGFVAGVYARVDEKRGVHKAPANEIVRGALGVARAITRNDQDRLNPAGVNVIRTFPDRARPIIWGARTTVKKEETDWIYVNVRRLMLYIEESIEEGIRWAVFEPNNTELWKKLKRTIGEFLTRVWRSGALFGETSEEAFYVRIDEALNPPSTRNIGRLYIEIGVAAVRPAEFIIVRIGLWDDGSDLTES